MFHLSKKQKLSYVCQMSFFLHFENNTIFSLLQCIFSYYFLYSFPFCIENASAQLFYAEAFHTYLSINENRFNPTSSLNVRSTIPSIIVMTISHFASLSKCISILYFLIFLHLAPSGTAPNTVFSQGAPITGASMTIEPLSSFVRIRRPQPCFNFSPISG